MLILGIDPGSRITGYGIISQIRGKQEYVTSGCIKPDIKSELHIKLHQIYLGLEAIINRYKPNEVAVERVFLCHNVSSALKLGHARGAAMVAIAKFSLAFAEYSPRQVKQAVAGYGAADKHQVQQMVKAILYLSAAPKADAADALAVAICHGHCRNNYLKYGKK